MKVLVTGAAGFIGSTLSEKLLAEGHSVVGADCFLDYYPREAKERNLASLKLDPRFEFIETNLVHADLVDLTGDVYWPFPQAAQAGERSS